jgi:hypothetical protein
MSLEYTFSGIVHITHDILSFAKVLIQPETTEKNSFHLGLLGMLRR